MTSNENQPLPEVKSCGVLIVRGDPIESFLLMRHTNRWDLPKGHVDPGETDLECALRELEEETGISQGDVRLDPDFQFVHQYEVQYKRTDDQKKLKTLVIYLAHLLNDVEITTTEHLGYLWFDWNPPHKIQEQTIDPLLSYLEKYQANSR